MTIIILLYCNIETFTEIQEHFAKDYVAAKGAGMPQLFIA